MDGHGDATTESSGRREGDPPAGAEPREDGRPLTMDVGDHYRPTDGGEAPGVYRVVGAGDPVALLRVTDGDGRRIHGGELRRVDQAAVEAGFEPAADPDAGVSASGVARDVLQGLYWSVRRLLP